MVYHGLSSICQLVVHRCLTTRRVCFVMPRCADDGRRSSSGGNTDASVVNGASPVRELRCSDDEQCEFGFANSDVLMMNSASSICELGCSVAAVLSILWIIADSVDILADL
jgi:hypothetical protein